MKTLLKIFGGMLFIVILAVVSLKLFLPDLWEGLFQGFNNSEQVEKKDEITIVYSEPMSSFEPTRYDVSNRSRTINIYEGLVRTDRNLKIEPALAISWGMINDLVWEFKLRRNVQFHNGQEMTAQDVKASFERAKNYQKSEVASLMVNFEKVEIVDDYKIRIKTVVPDPIFLSKLAAIFIVPGGEVADKPVGTGQYSLKEWKKDDYVKLARFENYWGDIPKYEKVVLQTIVDRDERMQAAIEGKVDLLVNVPPSFVDVLGRYRIGVKVKPSLEVNFLMFNTYAKDSIFSDKNLRMALRYAFDKNVFVDLAEGYAHPVNQFVNRGVLGYNPDMEEMSYDLEKAGHFFDQVERFTRLKTTLDLAEGLDIFGEYIAAQLYELGIEAELNFMPPSDLKDKIASGESSFYFMGWRSELADVIDFYKSVVHRRTEDGRYGQYNGGMYKNKKVDDLIEEAEMTVDYEQRAQLLREIMKIIVEKDVLGIPLFGSEVIYGVKDEIKWDPRVDGYIIASEIY